MIDTDFDEVTDSDLLGYWRALDIVEDPSLSVSRKRAMLAHWASDIHAVGGAPALRNVRGVTVSIDSLLEALAKLDDEIDATAIPVQAPNGHSSSW